MNDLLREALAPLPGPVALIAEDIIEDEYLGEGVDAMLERPFSSATAAVLAGIAMMPTALSDFEESMDDHFQQRAKNRLQTTYDEVVVGGGLHAAVYCAVRARMGKPKPLVLDKARRVGGTFAMSKGPSFYLNSRNRPGDLTTPGRTGGLNVIPGAIIQPADLSTEEYQTNWALAFSIRTTLACFADVRHGEGHRVLSITRTKGSSNTAKDYPVTVKLNNGQSLRVKRVILATGLGEPVTFNNVASTDRLMTFPQFMAKMDERFPLAGMKRVAVIGGGDSARTAVEALTGQGPQAGWSVASLDWPEQIDWYGCPYATCEDWVAYNRSRYKRIGPLLRPDQDGKRRVIPRGQVSYLSTGFNQVIVDERPYDHVFSCVGFSPNSEDRIQIEGDTNTDSLLIGGRTVGRFNYTFDRAVPNQAEADHGVISVGPAARIALTSAEQRAIGSAIPENATALFRYASRTAAVAASLK